jgi:hypothetical protein
MAAHIIPLMLLLRATNATECVLGDLETCSSIIERDGVVVFRSVATEADLRRGEELFWEWVERARPGVKRHDPTTHTTKVWNR